MPSIAKTPHPSKRGRRGILWGAYTRFTVTLSNAARKGCRTGIQRDRGNNDNVVAGVTQPGIITDCTNIMRDNGFDSTKFIQE